MSDDGEYSSLPLDERLKHKLWKARLEAYDELTTLYQNRNKTTSDDDGIEYENGDLLKRMILDSNVVAQESGYKCFVAYLTNVATVQSINRLKSMGIVGAICEKGLSSSRKGTKELAVESILLIIEISPTPNDIVDDILPNLSNKLPKLVIGCISCLTQIIHDFGCIIISPKPILEYLPKLFAHADKNVRSESTKLTLEIYKWMGDSLKNLIFDDLKPIQQKDLSKAFDLITIDKPVQIRLTRSQKIEADRIAESQNFDTDVVMEQETPLDSIPQFDPLDLIDPVEVLSKFPPDLNERINSSIWKDRKEVLEEVHSILEKSKKIVPNDDYTSIFRTLAKCMKDANIQVVQLAGDCIMFLVKGLKNNFSSSYKSIILLPIIERTKEKKQSVADSLNNALDSIFAESGLSSILDDTLTGMRNKTPQIKISATNYLQRCLANTSIPPSSGDIDLIMSQGVKLLSESQEPIRQASTEMIGTLMKITGERELIGVLENVDDNRKSKVKAFYETVEVKAKKSSPVSSQSSKTRIEPIKKKLAPPTSTSASSLPSKRTATSPAKRTESLKQSSYGRGLTGRSLTQLSNAKPKAREQVNVLNMEIDQGAEIAKLKLELESLNSEKSKWVAQKNIYEESINSLKQETTRLSNQLNQVVLKSEDLYRDINNATMLVKQKDTQINRLNNDLEGERLKNKDLEQQIEMMKLQQNKKSFTNTSSNQVGANYINRQNQTAYYNTPSSNSINHNISNNLYESNHLKSPELPSRVASGELSSRVNRLSIDSSIGLQQRDLNIVNTSHHRYESPKRTNLTPNKSPSIDLDTNDDSWKRAAEVTSKLKERIEKMKARSRGSQNEFNSMNSG